MKDIKKETRIKAEIKRLDTILKDIDKNTVKGVKSLIENASFMAITLDDLQVVINEEGVISKYQNGENQWGTKKSPEVEVYNTMIKNHLSIMKQLTDLLPKKITTEDDGFDKFINGRSD